MDDTIRWIRRLRDSVVPELTILFLILIYGVIAFKIQVPLLALILSVIPIATVLKLLLNALR